MQVEELFIYPVKGLKAQEVASSWVERRGLRFDRRWMLVDENGVFLSQRKLGKMATLRARVEFSVLRVCAPGQEELLVPISETGTGRQVTVWNSVLEADPYPEEVNQWFSDALDLRCSLVIMPEHSVRATNPAFSLAGDHVSFADGYPVTLASKESLDDLNARLSPPIPMDRFRPNIVARNLTEPWIEETWCKIRVGGTVFRVAKPCGRCLVTTIDQDTGALTGAEPLKTLGAFRQKASTVDFSIHLIPEEEGEIRVGDAVEVV